MQERSERSVEQIIFMLEENGIIKSGSLAYSILSRQLRLAGAVRKELINSEGYRRFEAEDVHVIWQSDFQHTLYLPDPKTPNARRRRCFCYSGRLLPLCSVGPILLMKSSRLEDSLKKAILRWGYRNCFTVITGRSFPLPT